MCCLFAVVFVVVCVVTWSLSHCPAFDFEVGQQMRDFWKALQSLSTLGPHRPAVCWAHIWTDERLTQQGSRINSNIYIYIFTYFHSFVKHIFRRFHIHQQIHRYIYINYKHWSICNIYYIFSQYLYWRIICWICLHVNLLKEYIDHGFSIYLLVPNFFFSFDQHVVVDS